MVTSVTVSTALVASSQRRTGASLSRARPMATRCFSPPDSLRPRSPTRVAYLNTERGLLKVPCAPKWFGFVFPMLKTTKLLVEKMATRCFSPPDSLRPRSPTRVAYLYKETGLKLAYTRYFFTYLCGCKNQSPLYYPRPFVLHTLLQYNCATFAQYMTSPRPSVLMPYTIQYG